MLALVGEMFEQFAVGVVGGVAGQQRVDIMSEAGDLAVQPGSAVGLCGGDLGSVRGSV